MRGDRPCDRPRARSDRPVRGPSEDRPPAGRTEARSERVSASRASPSHPRASGAVVCAAGWAVEGGPPVCRFHEEESLSANANGWVLVRCCRGWDAPPRASAPPVVFGCKRRLPAGSRMRLAHASPSRAGCPTRANAGWRRQEFKRWTRAMRKKLRSRLWKRSWSPRRRSQQNGQSRKPLRCEVEIKATRMASCALWCAAATGPVGLLLSLQLGLPSALTGAPCRARRSSRTL